MKHLCVWWRIRSVVRPRLFWCLALSLVALSEPALATIQIIDDRGHEICLEYPASSVIALYGSFSEMLVNLDREEILLARTAADDWPPSFCTKPVVGTHLRPNLEQILGLGPDLVVQLGGRADALETAAFLEKRGLVVAVFQLESFADIFASMERLGVLTGRAELAQARVQAMQAELKTFKARQPERAPNVFFEARYPNLLSVGQNSLVNEIIRAAGAHNVVQAPGKLVRLAEEELLRLDPDLYLVQRGPMNPAPTALETRPGYAVLSCVRQGRVFTVDQQLFSRPGPRSLEAVRQLAALVQQWNQEVGP